MAYGYLAGGGSGNTQSTQLGVSKGSLIVVQVAQAGGSLGTVNDGYNSYYLYSSNNSNTAPQSYNFYAITQIDLPAGTNIVYTPTGSTTSTSISVAIFAPASGEKFALPIISTSSTDLIPANNLSTTINNVIAPAVIIGTTVMSSSSSYNVIQDLNGGSAWTGTFFDIGTGLGSAFKITNTNTSETFNTSFSTSTAFQTLLAFPIVLDVAQVQSTSGGSAGSLLYNSFRGQSSSGANLSFNIVSSLTPQRLQSIGSASISSVATFNTYSNAIANPNAKEYLNFQSSIGSSIVAETNGRAYLTPSTNAMPNQSGGVSGGSISFAPVSYTISSKVSATSDAYLDQTQALFTPLTTSSTGFASSNAKEYLNFQSLLYPQILANSSARDGINFKTNIIQSVNATVNGIISLAPIAPALSLRLSATSSGYFDPTLSLTNITYDSATGIALSNGKEFANFKSILYPIIAAGSNAFDKINFQTNIVQSVNATVNGSISLAPVSPALPLRLSAMSNGYIDPVFNTNLLITSSTAIAQSNAKEFANFKSLLYPVISAESNAFDKINFQTNIKQSVNTVTDADSTFVMSFGIKLFANIVSNGYFDPLLNPINTTLDSSSAIADSNAYLKIGIISSVPPIIGTTESNSADRINFQTNIKQSVNATSDADSLFSINFLFKIFGNVAVNGYFDGTLNPINATLDSSSGTAESNGIFNLALRSSTLPIIGIANANSADRINFQTNIKQSVNATSIASNLINLQTNIIQSVNAISNGYVSSIIPTTGQYNPVISANATTNGLFNVALRSSVLSTLAIANSNANNGMNFQSNIKQSINAVSNGSTRANLPSENIKNGSFEIGIDYWTGINNSISISNNIFAGVNSLLITEVDPYTEHQAGPLGAKQDFYAYGPNRNYNLTAYVQNTSSNARNMYLQIAWADGTVSQGILVYVDQSSGWVKLSLNTNSNSIGIATAYVITSAPFNSLNGDTALIDSVSMQITELSTADYGISNISSSMSAKATSTASFLPTFISSPTTNAYSTAFGQEKFSFVIPLSLDPIAGAVAQGVSNAYIITNPRTVLSIFPAFVVSNTNISTISNLTLGKLNAQSSTNGYVDPSYNVNTFNLISTASGSSNAKEFINFQSLLYPIITQISNARDGINFKTNIIQSVNSTTNGNAFTTFNAATLKLTLNAISNGYVDPTISSLAIINPIANAGAVTNGLFTLQTQYLPIASASTITNGYIGVISLKSNILGVLQSESSSDADINSSLRMIVSPLRLSTVSSAYIDPTVSSILVDALILNGFSTVSGLGSLSTTLNIKPVDAAGDSNVELISQSSGYINTRITSPISFTLSASSNANSTFNGSLKLTSQAIGAVSQGYFDASVNINTLIIAPKVSALSSAKEFIIFQNAPIINGVATTNALISTNSKTFVSQQGQAESQAYVSSILTQKLSIQAVNAVSSGYIDPTVSSISVINLSLNAFASSADVGGPGLLLNIQPVFIPLAPVGNIVSDQSFELGGGGWYGINVPIQTTNAYAQDGSQSLLVQQPLNTYDGTEYLTYPLGVGQNFKAVIGRTYQLSAYVQNIAGDAPRQMSAAIVWSNGQTTYGVPVYVSPSDGWVNLVVTGTAQAGGVSSIAIFTSMPFDSINGNNAGVVDNVSLQVIDTLNVNNTLGLLAESNAYIATKQTMPTYLFGQAESFSNIVTSVPSLKISSIAGAISNGYIDPTVSSIRINNLSLFASGLTNAKEYLSFQSLIIQNAAGSPSAFDKINFQTIINSSVIAQTNGYIANTVFSMRISPIVGSATTNAGIISNVNITLPLVASAVSQGSFPRTQPVPLTYASAVSNAISIFAIKSTLPLIAGQASSDADIITSRTTTLPLIIGGASSSGYFDPTYSPIRIITLDPVNLATSSSAFDKINFKTNIVQSVNTVVNGIVNPSYTSILKTNVAQAETNGYFDITISPVGISTFSLTQAPVSSGFIASSIVFAPYSNAIADSNTRDLINFKSNIVQSINTISDANINYSSPVYLKGLVATATSNGDVAGLLGSQPITLSLAASSVSGGKTGEKLQYFLIPYQVADVLGNNLNNGSFDADISFWSGISNSIYVKSDLGYDNKNSLIVSSPDYVDQDYLGPVGAKQDFKTYLGRTYSAEAYVQNLTDSTPRDMYLQIEWSNGTVVKGKTVSVSSSDGWVRLSLDLASSPTNGTATLFVVTSNTIPLFNINSAAIDYVSVTQLPSVLPSANGFALGSLKEKITFQTNIIQSVVSDINGLINPGLINNIKSNLLQAISNGQLSVNVGQTISLQPAVAESNGYFDPTLSPVRIITLDPLNAVGTSFAREKITLVEQTTTPYLSGNLVINPTFAQGTYGWSSLAAATLSTSSYGYDDTNSLMVLDATDGNAGITQKFVVSSGLNYTLSAYVQNLTGITPRLMYVQILWADGTTSTSSLTSVGSSDGWVRLYVTGMSPKAGIATATIVTSTPGFFETNEQTLIDCVLLEQTDTLNPFYYGINTFVTGIAGQSNGLINPKLVSYIPTQAQAQTDADITTSSVQTIKLPLSAASNGFIDPLVSSIATFSPYSNATADTNGNLVTRILYVLDGSASAAATNGDIPKIFVKNILLANLAQAQSGAFADTQITISGTIKNVIGTARTDADGIFGIIFNPYSNATATPNAFEKFDLVQTIQPGDVIPNTIGGIAETSGYFNTKIVSTITPSQAESTSNASINPIFVSTIVKLSGGAYSNGYVDPTIPATGIYGPITSASATTNGFIKTVSIINPSITPVASESNGDIAKLAQKLTITPLIAQAVSSTQGNANVFNAGVIIPQIGKAQAESSALEAISLTFTPVLNASATANLKIQLAATTLTISATATAQSFAGSFKLISSDPGIKLSIVNQYLAAQSSAFIITGGAETGNFIGWGMPI